jgi:hypothetical protein
MSTSLESVKLTDTQQAELANLGCDDLAARESLTLDTLRAELDKLKADAELDKACRSVLSRSGMQTEILMAELANNPSAPPASSDADPKNKDDKKDKQKEGTVLSEWELPVAPVTTFNVIRLIQLGYIPLNKPEGKMGVAKWTFYWPNVATQWGNGKVNAWALDWANSKGGGAYRSMLEADISKINDELKGYQKNTAATFGMKVELEKQLTLLESLKSEKDPKKIMEIANDYVTSRSKTHFSASGVGYDMPAARKSTVDLDAEITRAETKTQAREDRIKADEQDLKALTTKWVKDSTGKVRITKEEIEEQNRRRVERATSLSDRKISELEKKLVDKQAEQQKFQTQYNTAKANSIQLQKDLSDVLRHDTRRTIAEIAVDQKTYRANPKVMSDLNKELANVNERIRLKRELWKLWYIDHIGNPIFPVAPATSVVYSVSKDLESATNDVKKLEWDITQARKNKDKLIKDTTKKGQDALDAHAKEVALKQKHITQWKDLLTKRQEAEVRVVEVNWKIKDIEAKLAAVPPPVAHERLQLESELKSLYAQKNAAAVALDTALKSNNWRNDAATKSAVEWQKTEVQKELDKLRQLSVEMDTVKWKIDAIQAEAQAAKDALNNERDPVKAKKLRDELPAKINAANQQILELNNAGKKLTDGTGIDWKKIPDVELRSVLGKNLLLAKFLATPQGVITKAETFGQTPGWQKTMKVVYGGLKYVAIAGAARTVGNQVAAGDMKAAGLDALDAGMGFLGMIPGGNIVSWIYDIGMAGKQFATWTDINGRQVSTTQSFVRLGFGVVWLIPVVGNVVKWAAAAKWAVKTVATVEKIESAASTAMKWAMLAQVGTLTYDVVDVTANMFRDPIDTAIRVVKWHQQRGVVMVNESLPHQTMTDLPPTKVSK